MADQSIPEHTDTSLGHRIAMTLALLLVIVGLIHNIPTFPGLDGLARSLFGDGFIYRKFPNEYLYPIMFFAMMLIVATEHSWARKSRDAKPVAVGFNWLMDVGLVVAGFAIAAAYMIELEAVCLLDQITGKRAELIEAAFKKEVEAAVLLGQPAPTTVDDPKCFYTTGMWLFAIVGLATAIFLTYAIRVWGFPLVAVAILIAAYTIGTITIWYIFGSDGMSKYAVTKIGGEDPRQLSDGLTRIKDVLTNHAGGFLGRFMTILFGTVFPYLILGALFGVSAGGASLIKLAFNWTRRLPGGPAHAAIVSSAIFGTISGGPVVNVLSTGVLTIPMMLKRGFSKLFAGGVEAAASSGGQIMPPVMGVAAFVLAAMTVVPYRLVIIAAIIPAIAYFGCLFLTVLFQSRKQGIAAVGELSEDMKMTREDWVNFLMIILPIALIVVLLLTPKDSVGCGVLGGFLGNTREFTEFGCTVTDYTWFHRFLVNVAGDTGAAGWLAVFLLMGLLFLDKNMRAKPSRLLGALAKGGILVSTLYLMFVAISIIDFSLNLTDLSGNISRDILAWLKDLRFAVGNQSVFLMVALILTMFLSILLGMGMPTVPAYLNVILLMGPLLVGLGTATFTAHMFVFYFAVASAITPPVAVAAFAAASITKAEPMATGLAAVRAGIVMFVIPFVFCFYPELLLIDHAIRVPEGVTVQNVDGSFSNYIEGYQGGFTFAAIASIVARLVLSLYLLASALAGFDAKELSRWEITIRLVLAVLCIAKPLIVFGPAIAVALVYLFVHHSGAKEARSA